MIKKFTLSTIGACVLAMGISAGAATVTSVVVTDFDNSKVTVSGTVESNETSVGVYIERVGGPGLVVGSNNAPADLMIKPATIITAEDGTKTFVTEEFVFNASGAAPGVEYNVYASDQTSPYVFKFVEKNAVISFADNLAIRLVPQSDIFAQMQNYGSSLGADIAFATTPAKQGYLAQTLIDYSSRIAEKPASSTQRIEAVKSIVNLAKAELEFMEALASTVVQTGVDYYVNQYSTSAEIDISAYSLLSVEAKTVVCGNFVGKTYLNMATFRNEWNLAITNASAGLGQQGGGQQGDQSPIGNANASPSGAVPTSPSGGVNTSGSELLSKYKDVAQAEWAVEAIEYVVKNGIMQGTANDSFEPNTKVTREQVAKIIAIAFDSYNESATSPFKDVPQGHWSVSYVGSAYASGLLTGKNDTEFGLGEEMTREDLCTVMYRAATKAGYNFVNENSDFIDFENVNSYAQQAVKSLAGAKIISGMGDGVLAPKGTATRAQTAQMLMKLAELIK